MQDLTFSFAKQTLAWTDLIAVLLLIIIEVFLSIDNALILFNLTSKLKENERKKALFIGLFTSFILRLLLLFFAIYLLKFPLLKALGGLYLIYIGIHSLKANKKDKKKNHTNFWLILIAIEAIDLVFALDSMLAAYSFASIYYPFSVLNNKIWVIYLAIIIGVVVLRSSVFVFVKFFQKIPHLQRIICLFILLMGGKLIVDASISYVNLSVTWLHIIDIIFWILAILTIFLGFISTKSRKNS